MKMNRILVVAMAGLGVAGWSMSASADAAAGKAKFEAACAECHEVATSRVRMQRPLADSLTKMAAGTMKHKQAIKLSPAGGDHGRRRLHGLWRQVSSTIAAIFRQQARLPQGGGPRFFR